MLFNNKHQSLEVDKIGTTCPLLTAHFYIRIETRMTLI